MRYLVVERARRAVCPLWRLGHVTRSFSVGGRIEKARGGDRETSSLLIDELPRERTSCCHGSCDFLTRLLKCAQGEVGSDLTSEQPARLQQRPSREPSRGTMLPLPAAATLQTAATAALSYAYIDAKHGLASDLHKARALVKATLGVRYANYRDRNSVSWPRFSSTGSSSIARSSTSSRTWRIDSLMRPATSAKVAS